jgi:hypothetical protein
MVVVLCNISSIQTASAQDEEVRSPRGPISSQDSEALFRQWLEDQQEQLARVESLVVEADVDHRVATASGERMATYGLLFSRLPDGPQGRGTLRYFILDGDSLDVSERRRVERIISSMMTEELGPLLNGLNMPTRLLSRIRPVGDPVRLEMDGNTLVRFVFELEPPVRQSPPNQRPGVRPGARPGFPQQGRRLPSGRMRPEGPEGPRPRMSVFIDEASGHLVMTRVRAVLPGERPLTSETTFQRIDGVDLPLSRHVAGDFPMRRRLRTVTVSLDHRSEFRVERLVIQGDQ